MCRQLWKFYILGFPGGSDGKASAHNAGDLGSIPGSGRSLEKEMATNSSTLAWKIPWTEEPCKLQSTGSQSRARLSDVTSLHLKDRMINEKSYINIRS